MAAIGLEDIRAYIHEVGLGKARLQILKNQLLARKGRILDSLTDEVTHVIVGGKMTLTKLSQALHIEEVPGHVHVVSADWLSACFVHDNVVPVGPYLVAKSTPKPSPQKAVTSQQQQQHPADAELGEDVGRVVDDAPKDFAKHNLFGSGFKGKRPRISRKKNIGTGGGEIVRWVDSDSDYVDSDEEHGVRLTSGDEGQAEKVEGMGQRGVNLHGDEDTVSKSGPSPKKVGSFSLMGLTLF